MSEMHVMDQTGHTSVTWDPAKPVEVEVAKATFDRLLREGYNAFEVNESDQQGSRMSAFNPKAGKVMMVPQLRGG